MLLAKTTFMAFTITRQNEDALSIVCLASGISVFDILKVIVARKMCKVTKDKWRML